MHCFTTHDMRDVLDMYLMHEWLHAADTMPIQSVFGRSGMLMLRLKCEQGSLGGRANFQALQRRVALPLRRRPKLKAGGRLKQVGM